MDEQEKREVEQKIEEKKKDAPWWQRLSPLVLGGAALILVLIWQSAQNNPELKTKYEQWGLAILVILYLISRTNKHEEKRIITAREAKILTAKECEFNKKCNEYPFTTMCRYQVGPINPWRQTDASGTFCDVAVKVWAYPTDKLPKHYTATVITKGEAMGVIYFTESVGANNGREKKDSVTLVPKWMKQTQKYPVMEKLLFNRGRGGDNG